MLSSHKESTPPAANRRAFDASAPAIQNMSVDLSSAQPKGRRCTDILVTDLPRTVSFKPLSGGRQYLPRGVAAPTVRQTPAATSGDHSAITSSVERNCRAGSVAYHVLKYSRPA